MSKGRKFLFAFVFAAMIFFVLIAIKPKKNYVPAPDLAVFIYQTIINMEPHTPIGRIEECAKSCPPAEAEIAQKAFTLTTETLVSRSKIEEFIEPTTELVLLALAHYESTGDVESILKLHDAGNMLLDVQRRAKTQVLESEFSKKMTARLQNLPTKFPTRSEAFRIKGYFLLTSQAPEEETIEAFLNCTIIAPKNEECKKAYKARVKTFLRTSGRQLPDRLKL